MAEKLFFCSSSGKIELEMTLAQAQGAAHQGKCDADVKALSEEPDIAAQLAKIDGAELVKELDEYGSWDAVELADHAQNLQRILWLACWDVLEEHDGERDETGGSLQA